MKILKGNFKRIISSAIAVGMLSSMVVEAKVLTSSKDKAQIIVDYNTSIGTGSKYLFGGSGIPNPNEQLAWSLMNNEMGVKLIKVPVDLARLYPNKNGEIDTNVKEEYLHVASGQLTRAKGAGMDVMLEFINLPSWLDLNNDKKFDDEGKYTSMIKEFLNEANDYKDIIKFVEIVPDSALSSNDFIDVYFKTAKAVRSASANYKIGGPGYVLTSKDDSRLGKIENLLNEYKNEKDKSLIQYVSVRAHDVNVNSDEKDYFGEFKEGRKSIRRWSENADLPIYMTGWTTVSKNSNTPDENITGNVGIKQQASALFKGMRDGWSGILFNSTTSNKQSPSSYTYKVNENGDIILNPFAKAWNLLSNKLKLGNGDFKVVSTDMGSNWIVDDSIAMINSSGEPVILATNFSDEKRNITLELKNIPYEDGDVELECYVASEGKDVNSPYVKVAGKVVNGILNATIPSIPSNGATGIIVKNGRHKELPAQTIYEFESQDNHFGGNTEITWKTGASFNRIVKNFNGVDNFVTLRKVQADGDGTYRALLYILGKNSRINVSVNGNESKIIDGSNGSLSKPVEFDINLNAGNNNTIKFWSDSGELNADKLVLVPKDIKLSIGFQNLDKLGAEGSGDNKRYIFPLERKDFTVDGRIFPENSGTSNKLEYTSSNPEVVSVSNSGLLTPIKTGEAVITANIQGNNDISNSFKLVVKNAVASIEVNPKNITMKKDEEAVIEATISPENAETKDVVWTTSNSNVVKIEKENGNKITIKAISESGNAIITAKSVDGGYEATSSITVVKPIDGGSINIDYGNTIAEGSKDIFGVTHYPSINKKDNDIGDHSKVWEMLRDDMGVKFMRADARLQEILPVWTKTPNIDWASNSDIKPGQPSYVEADYYYVEGPDGVKRQFSVEGYKKDMEYYRSHGKYLNGMSNPENWNTDRLMSWVKKAKEMGFDVMVMTFQIPEWLASGYPLPGAPHTEKACNSAPKDWEIFRDIVKKVYKMLKPYADYYELLNEPHWYIPQGGNQLRPDGTPYPSSNKVNLIAADTMYQAIDAMYEAEIELTGDPNAKPTMKLGGGSDDSWGGEYGVLGTLFSKEYENWHDRVEFVSIHKYGSRPANQDTSNEGANSRNLKYWLRDKTGKEMPIFLNEYNASTGQPHEYHTGAKSMSYHGRNLIDMMIDGYSGGGYYTCYPSDVPMDDYEASKGWVERGKGVYAWNNGSPTLATFTKTWNLLSKKLGLGDGDFKVKSTEVKNSKISDGIGAINIAGNPIAFLTNYSNEEYGNITVKMNNLPFKSGANIKAKVYSMTTSSSINIKPVENTLKVNEDGSVEVTIDSIGANGISGIILEGDTISINNKTLEFESYMNTFTGTSKILVEEEASNGRWLSGISDGENNSVTLSIDANKSGRYKANIYYEGKENFKMNYKVNDGNENSVNFDKTLGISKKEIEIAVKEGINKIKFYSDEKKSGSLDKLDISNFYEEEKPVVNKDALKELIEKNKDKNEDKYTEESFKKFKDALSKGENVLNKENATQEEVENAIEELELAIKGLIEKPTDEKPVVNKNVLKELIEKNKDKNEEKYTEESFKKFKDTLSKGENVLNKENATQEEVDNAIEELELAIKGLVLNKEDSSNNNENNSDNDVNGGNNSNESNSDLEDDSDKNKLPSTGRNPIFPITIGIIALVGGVIVYKKRVIR
ncbi:Ig-like domain-containing protein [Clostridium sardiniense]|uniref:Ig-like domain-containing protein n=1 Tax=Clostridium sardiniense TaxID=29369 RepID=UPI003D331C70